MSDISTHKISYDDWLQAAEKALGGRDIATLTKKSFDNIEIKPLYENSIDANQAPLPLGAWQIVQAINHPDIKNAKAQIAQDLEQGVNALNLITNDSILSNGYGINLNQVNIHEILSDVYLEMIHLRLETGASEIDDAKVVEEYYQQKGLFEKSANLSLGIDPISKMAQMGGIHCDVETLKNNIIYSLKNFKAKYILRVDGRIAHNAGASEAQELAFIISSAYTYLKWANEANLNLNDVAGKIEISISVTQNQFISIAKTRALRQLWSELLDGLGISPKPASIYAETSMRMVTKRDPWVNILRITVACFAAGLGGANQVGALPLSAAIGLAPEFDRRIARHIQTILIEESHLGDITDPSLGSSYVESLTQDITQKSWTLFQTIENSGGIIANLKNDHLQNLIATVAAKRDHMLAHRHQAITGSSEFPNLNEDDYECEKVKVTAQIIPKLTTTFAALTLKRDAEMFETLRDKSDAILASQGVRPNIFMAKIGGAKDYLTRSTFAKNFFEVGGIEVLEGSGGVDIGAIIDEYKQSRASYAIIASSDEMYKIHACQLAKALKLAGASHIYFAGAPKAEFKDGYLISGIDDFISIHSDLVETLTKFYCSIDAEAK